MQSSLLSLLIPCPVCKACICPLNTFLTHIASMWIYVLHKHCHTAKKTSREYRSKLEIENVLFRMQPNIYRIYFIFQNYYKLLYTISIPITILSFCLHCTFYVVFHYCLCKANSRAANNSSQLGCFTVTGFSLAYNFTQ